ncbi:MAG: polysaccharide deacetylase family protein [Clostridia bacterium]|nr:polysaccharide deacetylase family protein [Clostridia bacterium]
MRRVFCLVLAALFIVSIGLPVFSEVPPKKIALTFDDGPHAVYTAEILSILNEYKIKGTFFVVGQNAEEHPSLVKQTSEEGHEIGNHTYSHPKLKEQNAESFSFELEKTKAVIESITGVSPILFRPPEGFREGVIKTVAKEQGYQMVLWSVDTEDWRGLSADRIEKAIMKDVKDGSIILCHDYVVGQSHTPEALRRVIPRLLEEGYEFVTVSDLLRKR